MTPALWSGQNYSGNVTFRERVGLLSDGIGVANLAVSRLVSPVEYGSGLIRNGKCTKEELRAKDSGGLHERGFRPVQAQLSTATVDIAGTRRYSHGAGQCCAWEISPAYLLNTAIGIRRKQYSYAFYPYSVNSTH